MANVKKPFMRTVSLGSMFKRKRETPYQSYEDEDSLLDESTATLNRTTEVRRLEFREESPQIEEQDCPAESSGSIITAEPVEGELQLGDCFYLGCYDMTGLSIRGRGCIDFPAGHIWEQTQEDWQKKHKSSLPSRLDSSKPKYVRLVAAMDELKVYDCHTGKLVFEFDYKSISFVGTHPRYTRLFAFIAVAKGKRVPFCHGFKCEDIESAENTAKTLSSAFDRKSKKLLAARLQQKIQVDISATVVN